MKFITSVGFIVKVKNLSEIKSKIVFEAIQFPQKVSNINSLVSSYCKKQFKIISADFIKTSFFKVDLLIC